MEKIFKRQISSIYAMGASLGLVEHGSHSHEDNLHQLVAAVTGTESVSQLSTEDADRVIRELMKRMRGFHPAPRQEPAGTKKKYTETPGGMTEGQQRKVWALMYELRKFDAQPSAAGLGDRLCGVIKHKFGVDASPKKPFAFLRLEDGDKLIETLKRYCNSAERHRLTGDSYEQHS